MSRYLITFVFLGIALGIGAAEQKQEVPKEAKTTAEILKVVESVKGFGTISSCEFRSAAERTFVVWFNPYSGRAACHVHGYHFDRKVERWVQFIGRSIEGTHDVSVEVGRVLTIRNVSGEVLFKDEPKKSGSAP
ncbi:MAG: hypothetical protein JWM11_7850 [Planctomycetaceae bacterium]|nr:hypothetical protein [Planctomycetaceae bacterium]